MIKKRGVNPIYLYSFLLVLAAWTLVHASCPLLTHEDTSDQREFQNVCQVINTKPSVYTGSGAPPQAPERVGDIYIATSTAKVYISTATVTKASWAILN